MTNPNVVEIDSQWLISKIGMHYDTYYPTGVEQLICKMDKEQDLPLISLDMNEERMVRERFGSSGMSHENARECIAKDIGGTRFPDDKEGLFLAKTECINHIQERFLSTKVILERQLNSHRPLFLFFTTIKEKKEISFLKNKIQSIDNCISKLTLDNVIVQKLPEKIKTLKPLDESQTFFFVNDSYNKFKVTLVKPRLVDFYPYSYDNPEVDGYLIYNFIDEYGDALAQVIIKDYNFKKEGIIKHHVSGQTLVTSKSKVVDIINKKKEFFLSSISKAEYEIAMDFDPVDDNKSQEGTDCPLCHR